jgi:hypothetical protein
MGLALESEDGALCEDIAISNITLRDVVSAPLFWRLGARLRGPKETTKVGTLQRIVVNNLVSYNTVPHISSILSGIPEVPSAMSKSRTSTSSIRAAALPTTPGSSCRKMPTSTPTPACSDLQRPRRVFSAPRHQSRDESRRDSARNTGPAPQLYLEGVTRADFIAVTTPTSPPEFALNKVTDLRILLSRAATDTQLDSVDHKII